MPYGDCIDCTYCRINGLTAKEVSEEKMRRWKDSYESANERLKKFEEEFEKEVAAINADESLTKSQKRYRINKAKRNIGAFNVRQKAREVPNEEEALDGIACECRIRSGVKYVSGSEKNRVEFPTMHGGFVSRRMMGCGEFVEAK